MVHVRSELPDTLVHSLAASKQPLNLMNIWYVHITLEQTLVPYFEHT